ICCFVFSMFFLPSASAQSFIEENTHTYYIYYPVSIDLLDEDFSDNHEALSSLDSVISVIIEGEEVMELLSVTFGGAVSPEGGERINRRLSRGRLNSIENYVRSRIEIPEEIITRNDNYIDWPAFIELLDVSELANKDEVRVIVGDVSDENSVEEDDDIVRQLRKMGSAAWNNLNREVFSKMRYGYVRFHVREIVRRTPPADIAEEDTLGANPERAGQLVPIAPLSKPAPRHLYLKTDLPALGMLIANLGIEVDVVPHLSVSVPFYYSGWNYSGETTKFRTSTLRPEVRFWPKAENQGLFVGAHLGLSWFNVATGGEYRYQDRDAKSPAIGGGLNVGYRLPISRDQRLNLEFSVGAGGYKVEYDVFHNAPDTDNGVYIKSCNKTYFGLDHASISLSYKFNLNSKKR
ncbi:MAG: DUF3575 domain-containing protein, partial [Tidjanibacter sp.]|nr:DUF3575 domain-containing protein [Tidjanibacter sp.]